MQTLFSLWAERLQNSVQQHPRRVLAGVAVSLSLLGGGAFAVASLDANSSQAPLQQVLESVSTLSLPSLAADKSLQLFRSDVTRSNDTADSLLSRLGLSDAEAAAYLRNARTARQQFIGRAGRLVSAEGDAEHRLTRLTARWANDDGENFTRWVMERNADGFVERQETAPLNSSTRMGNGSIQSSLFAATDEADIPDSVASQLADIFAGDIDFHRALRKGAVFSVVYETLEAEGEPLRAGRLLSAEITNEQKTYIAVWFQEPGQKGAYFTLKGDSLRRAFLASPMPYSRRTSGFGMREHPIFHTQRAHMGVDYAAPTGAPVISVADGVVVESGFSGGFGNMVTVQHNGRQSTVYAHLSRINVRKGQSIKQGDTVGAVGSTGWATGPHLHFEFRINGRHVDPLTLAQQGSSEPISAAQRNQFNQRAEFARTQLMAAAQMRQSNVQ